jgi:hypothetical protein
VLLCQWTTKRRKPVEALLCQITNGSKKSIKKTIGGQLCHFWHHSYHVGQNISCGLCPHNRVICISWHICCLWCCLCCQWVRTNESLSYSESHGITVISKSHNWCVVVGDRRCQCSGNQKMNPPHPNPGRTYRREVWILGYSPIRRPPLRRVRE